MCDMAHLQNRTVAICCFSKVTVKRDVCYKSRFARELRCGSPNMKYPGRRIAACAVLVCGFVLSCSRDASSGRPVRLAILPIENLTNDTGLDWLGAASSAVLTYDLTGLKDVVPVRTPTIEAARSSGATRYVEGYFEPDHGKLAFRAQVEDAAKHTVAQELRIDAAADSAVQALDGLARQ